MNNKLLSTALALSLGTMFFTGCHHENANTPSKHETKPHSSKHWSYKGDTSPSHWGDLNEKYHMCKIGNQQSPIDITKTVDGGLKSLDIKYTTEAKNIINNGHTVQVNIKDGSTLTLDGTAYSLKQFHFHTPSENNIMGHSFKLEAHFVHADEKGNLAVIGVMFKDGENNSALQGIWDKLPKDEGIEKEISFKSYQIKQLLPSDKSYYHFMGSLTTPPCSENVKWYVMKNPLEISKEQVDLFFNLYGHSNNRPLQALNNREVKH